MRAFCNKTTRFLCCHGGECVPADTGHGVAMGCSDSVTARMLLDGTISGCPVPAPAKPCTKVTQILTGQAHDYEIGGSPPLLAKVVALTDGGPPGVVTASGPVGSCVLFANGVRYAPRHPAAGAVPPTKPLKPLTFSLRLDSTYLAEKQVSRGWLPDGVTVTVVQPGKPTYWQTQFVRFETGDVPTPVRTDLPADRDTFVVITSHPGVNDVAMLELIDAPPPLVGLGTDAVARPGWTQGARRYADVIAAAPSQDGLTDAVVARANLPWAEPTKQLPTGLVFRVPQKIVGQIAPELLLRPAYPELLRLTAALEGAEPVVSDAERSTETANIVDRMSLAIFCKQVLDGGDTLYEKSFARLSDVAPRTLVLDPYVRAHMRGVPRGALDHTLPDEILHEYALKLHVRRTAALAKHVLPLLRGVRDRLGNDARGAEPLALDCRKYEAASPFFLGTAEPTPSAPEAVAITYAARTAENEAGALVDRAITVIDHGLGLLVQLQAMLAESERPFPAAAFEEWGKWMVETIARWECAIENDEVKLPTEFGKLFSSPARGWPLLVKRADTLAKHGWKVVGKSGALRAGVGAARDRLMRWAALRPESGLLDKLVRLTDPVEELAGKLSLKDLSDLDKYAKAEERLSKLSANKLAQARDAKAQNLNKKAREKAAGGYAFTQKARTVGAARQDDGRQKAMRWLLAPLVVLRVMNFVTSGGLPKWETTRPEELELLRQVHAVGDMVKLVTDPVKDVAGAVLDAKISAIESKPALSKSITPKDADKLTKLKGMKADLAKFAKPFDHALTVMQTTVALGDAWADWRRGDRTAAGLEVASVVVQFGTRALGAVPYVGWVVSAVASWAAGELFTRWIREAKATGDDLALRDLLQGTEFGKNGTVRATVDHVKGDKLREAFDDELYRGRCARPGAVLGEAIRTHLYQRQLTAWLTRLPSGPGLAQGFAAGVTVQFQPLAAQSRFVRARLRTQALPTDRVPAEVVVTADAILGTGTDGKASYTATITIDVPEPPQPVPFASDLVMVLAPLGQSFPAPPRPDPVTVSASDCLAKGLEEFAGKRVPAMMSVSNEPVFFVDPWQHRGNPLTVTDVPIAEGGSAWIVFGPAPAAQDLRTDRSAREFQVPIWLDVLTPAGAEEKQLALRNAHSQRYLSIQRHVVSAAGSMRGCGVFVPTLEVEILDRSSL